MLPARGVRPILAKRCLPPGGAGCSGRSSVIAGLGLPPDRRPPNRDLSQSWLKAGAKRCEPRRVGPRGGRPARRASLPPLGRAQKPGSPCVLPGAGRVELAPPVRQA